MQLNLWSHVVTSEQIGRIWGTWGMQRCRRKKIRQMTTRMQRQATHMIHVFQCRMPLTPYFADQMQQRIHRMIKNMRRVNRCLGRQVFHLLDCKTELLYCQRVIEDKSQPFFSPSKFLASLRDDRKIVQFLQWVEENNLSFSLLDLNLEDFHHISAESLVQIVRRCPQVKRVNLRGCRHVNERVLSMLVQSCPDLEFLNMNHCTGITNKALREVLHNAKCLKELHVQNCFLITDDLFSDVGKMIHLQIIDLRHCQKLTHRGIVQLLRHTPNLERLVLSGCYQLTDRFMLFLPSSVKVLHIDECKEITCLGLLEISRRCSLQELSIIGIKIDLEDIENIVKESSKLKLLRISETMQASQLVARLFQINPELKITFG